MKGIIQGVMARQRPYLVSQGRPPRESDMQVWEMKDKEEEQGSMGWARKKSQDEGKRDR